MTAAASGVALLDELASNARTALDDPSGLPDTVLVDGVHPADSREAAAAYAIAQCDQIISTLNPAEDTAATFAVTLRVLNAHLAERADEMLADGNVRLFVAAQCVRDAIAALSAAALVLDLVQPS